MAQSNVLLQPMPATATEPAALAVVTEAAVTETAVTEAVVTEAVAGSSAWWRHGDVLEPAFCLR